MTAHHPQNQKIEILDLTKVIDENLSIYSEGQYTDPPFQVESWCTVQSQGYQVSRLTLGTQTGTHLDAPAHFSANGASLEVLPVEALMGKYLWLDLDNLANHENDRFGYRNETFLFIASRGNLEIPLQVFEALLKLPCRVWVIISGVDVTGQDPFYFNRALAKAGKYLLEDLDEAPAQRVRPGGEILALPLRLRGVSGSPCRVIVRQPAVRDR